MRLQDRPYRHIRLPPGHIRVLELHPSSNPEARLACRLTSQRITDAPYEALSYVWGKPTVFHSSIVCQDADVNTTSGGILDIGLNLATALLAYRRPETPRRLWVDAVCIQQDDLDERLSQVRMMGDIFRNATQVLCWLGGFTNPALDKANAVTAINFLRDFNKDQYGHLQQIQAHLHKLHGDGGGVEHEGEALMETWRAIKVFFDCEYFHRAWIIQEIGLARCARLSWGHSNIWIDWKEIAHFVLFLDDNGASVINELDLKSWVCNHINLVWSNKADGTPLYDFSEVLHWARVHLSTDARDFVYSLLGHPSAVVDGELLIQPVYTISTAEVYTNLVVNTVQRTRSLHMLAFVDHGEEPNPMGLPTWVPDWHALNLVAPLRCPTRAAPREYQSVSVNTTAGMPQTLRCQGVVVGTIRALSDMISPKELAITDWESELKKQIPFLTDHVYDTLVLTQPVQTRPSVAEFITALSFVLTGAYRGNADATSGKLQEQQRSDFAAQIVKAETMRAEQPGSSPGPLFSSLSAEQAAYVRTLASSGQAAQIVQDMTWTSMCRRVFITQEGHLGLGPRTMASDDIVAVLPGSKFPLVLRKASVHSGSYELVGPALLYGFMDGEVEKVAAGTYLTQELHLV